MRIVNWEELLCILVFFNISWVYFAANKEFFVFFAFAAKKILCKEMAAKKAKKFFTLKTLFLGPFYLKITIFGTIFCWNLLFPKIYVTILKFLLKVPHNMKTYYTSFMILIQGYKIMKFWSGFEVIFISKIFFCIFFVSLQRIQIFLCFIATNEKCKELQSIIMSSIVW